MPNYKSSFLWFPNIAAMSSLLVDSTDEDGLVFGVAVDNSNWKLVTWRKNSTAAIDNTTVFAANGPGRWIALNSSSTPTTQKDMIQVSNLAALQAYADTPDQEMLYVLNTTPPVIYAWDAEATYSAFQDVVVVLTAQATGRMIKVDRTFTATTIPVGTPPFAGIEGVITLSSPAHTLTVISSATQWNIVSGPIIDSVAPTDAPLFVGATFLDTSTGTFYGAKGTSSIADWVAFGTGAS